MDIGFDRKPSFSDLEDTLPRATSDHAAVASAEDALAAHRAQVALRKEAQRKARLAATHDRIRSGKTRKTATVMSVLCAFLRTCPTCGDSATQVCNECVLRAHGLAKYANAYDGVQVPDEALK